jgi:Ca2+/Na+ antiporter
MKTIGKFAAVLFFVFGVLFVLSGFSTRGTPGNIITGIVLLLICFALAYFSFRKPAPPQENHVTVKIDLPGDVKMESLKCTSCGGALAPEHITMVAGAPVVNCPYCHTTYQLTEEPKW